MTLEKKKGLLNTDPFSWLAVRCGGYIWVGDAVKHQVSSIFIAVSKQIVSYMLLATGGQYCVVCLKEIKYLYH